MAVGKLWVQLAADGCVASGLRAPPLGVRNRLRLLRASGGEVIPDSCKVFLQPLVRRGVLLRALRVRTLDRSNVLREPRFLGLRAGQRRRLRSEVNSELNFPPNFEGLVLGCIDADFCK